MSDNQREILVNTAKNFKTNWVQLGELLTKVATEKLFIDWGFPNFEDYCKRELKIKKSTAIKLTNAYFFITKDEPKLADSGVDLDVVTVLRKAKFDENCPPEMFEEIRDVAIDKKRAASTVSKLFKEMISESGSKMAAFHNENLKLAQRLYQRIFPVGEVPEKYKVEIQSMIEFFQAQTQIKE